MVVISHKYKFIYIKTRKTASTSIEVLLSQYCGKDDIVTPLKNPTTEQGRAHNKRARNYKGLKSQIKILKYRLISLISLSKSMDIFKLIKEFNLTYILKKKHLSIFYRGFYNHITAKSIKLMLGKSIWDNYFKFTSERNPWSKLQSYYNDKINPDISFMDWLSNLNKTFKEHPINYPLYTINGKISVDFFCKYEQLKGDLKYVFQKINLPFKSLPKERVGKYQTKSLEEFSQCSKEIQDNIRSKYKKEIELFNYKL
ncbi:MAG: sulfotransferase family 2 domain-containing protein [Promethearchaeota archaeon]